MTPAIKAAVELDDRVDPEAIRALFPAESGVEIVSMANGSAPHGDERPRAVDLLVLACSGYSDGALKRIDTAVREDPSRPVVVFSVDSPNGFLERVFEAGADDIVVLPEPAEKIRFALEKAVARGRESRAAGAVKPAPMICVLGPKGGTGKTLTTANLAVSLADSGHRVVVVDLDLQFGDVGLALGLAPERTVYDLVKSGGSLDAEKLDAFLAQHPSGARVLLAPTRPDHASAVTVELLRETWRLLRSTHDYVIVDTPPDFTPEVIAAIDASSEICMVGMLDSLSLKNTKLGLETLERMGYDAGSVTLLLNRAGSSVGITVDDVAGILGRNPDVLVPSDRDIPRSVNQGHPIVLDKRRSEAAAAFRSLAAKYVGRPERKNGGGRRMLRLRKDA